MLIFAACKTGGMVMSFMEIQTIREIIRSGCNLLSLSFLKCLWHFVVKLFYKYLDIENGYSKEKFILKIRICHWITETITIDEYEPPWKHNQCDREM